MFVERTIAVETVRKNLEEQRLKASAEMQRVALSIADFDLKEFTRSDW